MRRAYVKLSDYLAQSGLPCRNQDNPLPAVFICLNGNRPVRIDSVNTTSGFGGARTILSYYSHENMQKLSWIVPPEYEVLNVVCEIFPHRKRDRKAPVRLTIYADRIKPV